MSHRRALRMLRTKRDNLGSLSDTAQLYYAVSLLIQDSRGYFTKAALSEALADPATVQAARALLKQAKS